MIREFTSFLKTKKKLFIIITILFSFFNNINGQEEFRIDTSYTIKKSKKILIATKKKLYKNPPTLNIEWNKFNMYHRKSIDCDDLEFDFLLVSFVDSEGHYANVIYKYLSAKNIEFLDSHFTIENPDNIIKQLENKKNYWNCDF